MMQSDIGSKNISGRGLINHIGILYLIVFFFVLAYGLGISALLLIIKLPFTIIFSLGIAIPIAILYLLLPLNYSATIFLIFMMLSHYYLSPIIFPVAGMELHPRELMNLAFISNFLVNVVFGRVYWRKSIFLIFAWLYFLFFIYCAVIGFLFGHHWQRVVAEIRFPLFFLSSFILPHCWKDLEQLKLTLRVMLGVSLIVVLMSYALFLYPLVTGRYFRVQNFLGEFLPYKVGPFRLQEVRFNGHMYFELWYGIFLSSFFAKEKWREKIKSLLLVIIFLFAILILKMNTALVSVFMISGIIIIAYLPSRLRLFFGLIFTFLILSFFLTLAYLFYSEILSWTNSRLGISLQARLVEVTGALQNFMESPLLGKGFGSMFVGLGLASNFARDLYAQATFQTLHNLWFYWLFKGGIIGMILIFSAFLGLFLKSAFLIFGKGEKLREDAYYWIGWWSVWISQILIISLAFPRISYPIGQVFFALSIACFIVLEGESEKTPVLDKPSNVRL
ncbi:MAG: hypothetical protein N3G21_06225 [Candidatus Hydrogenedentes bacterium]|nr:hypothetical protein [Candidatus Hydrogenedentota bacterium]